MLERFAVDAPLVLLCEVGVVSRVAATRWVPAPLRPASRPPTLAPPNGHPFGVLVAATLPHPSPHPLPLTRRPFTPRPSPRTPPAPACRLANAGYGSVRVVSGGFESWSLEGLPSVDGRPVDATWPLEDQRSADEVLAEQMDKVYVQFNEEESLLDEAALSALYDGLAWAPDCPIQPQPLGVLEEIPEEGELELGDLGDSELGAGLGMGDESLEIVSAQAPACPRRQRAQAPACPGASPGASSVPRRQPTPCPPLARRGCVSITCWLRPRAP